MVKVCSSQEQQESKTAGDVQANAIFRCESNLFGYVHVVKKNKTTPPQNKQKTQKGLFWIQSSHFRWEHISNTWHMKWGRERQKEKRLAHKSVLPICCRQHDCRAQDNDPACNPSLSLKDSRFFPKLWPCRRARNDAFSNRAPWYFDPELCVPHSCKVKCLIVPFELLYIYIYVYNHGKIFDTGGYG